MAPQASAMLTYHITIIPPFQIGLRAWQCVTVPHETRLCENPVDNQSVHAAKDNPVRGAVSGQRGGREAEISTLHCLHYRLRGGSTRPPIGRQRQKYARRSLFWFYFTVPKFMMCFTFEATRRVAVSLYSKRRSTAAIRIYVNIFAPKADPCSS